MTRNAFILLISAILICGFTARQDPVNISKPIFTRKGAVICPTIEAMHLAYNARIEGWRYSDAAGIDTPQGMYQGKLISAEELGCAVFGDGEALKAIATNGGLVMTDRGWIDRDDLRNVPIAAPKVHPVRPTLCGKHGTHCVYTDVHPYQPVR